MRCRRLLFLLPLLLAFSCSTPNPPGEVAFDFIEKFPSADVLQTPSVIRFGFVESDPYLVEGFETRKVSSIGWYRWSEGAKSRIRIPSYLKGGKRLTLVCKPFGVPYVPPQSIEIRVNGKPFAWFPLRKTWEEYGFFVPASYWRKGENELEFRFEANLSMGSRKLKQPSASSPVVFKELRIEPEYPIEPTRSTFVAAEPDPEKEVPALIQGPGCEIAYSDVLVRPNSILFFSTSVLSNEGSLRNTIKFEIACTPEGGSEEVLFSRKLSWWKGKGGPHRKIHEIGLERYAGRIVRFVFRCDEEVPDKNLQAVWRRPRILCATAQPVPRNE